MSGLPYVTRSTRCGPQVLIQSWYVWTAHDAHGAGDMGPALVKSLPISGDMGPAPLLEPPDWDTHSVESRYTEESKVGFDTQVTVVSILKTNSMLESKKFWSKNYVNENFL